MTSINPSHLSQTQGPWISLQSKTQRHFRGSGSFLSVYMFFSFLFSFAFPYYCKTVYANMQMRHKTNNGETECVSLCDPLNCVEEGLRRNFCATEAPGWATCEGLTEQSPSGLTCHFSSGTKWGMAVCVWDGCVRTAALRFVLGVYRDIIMHSSSVILVVIVWCFICCVMRVQWTCGESNVFTMG